MAEVAKRIDVYATALFSAWRSTASTISLGATRLHSEDPGMAIQIAAKPGSATGRATDR